MKRAGTALVSSLVLALAFALPAQAKELSEKSVRVFMEYAWTLVPGQFTLPSGKVIKIDKKKKNEVVVPIADAREIIRVGRMSAHAQICDLAEDQVLNYRSLMKRQSVKKKWSDQQMVFINQLHLTTVMLLTGKIKVVEKDGEKEVVVDQKPSGVTQTCTDEQKAKVKDIIAAYVSAGPKLASKAPPKTQPAADK